MDNGYEVVQIHEVWHWAEKRPQFFAGFVDKFLKMKTEASGWPSWCTNDTKKQEFLDQGQERLTQICQFYVVRFILGQGKGGNGAGSAENVAERRV